MGLYSGLKLHHPCQSLHGVRIRMMIKIIALAGFAALAGAGFANAQTDGPAELPPADYQGQSYVDSKGCIFLKAGYGGKSEWVPRTGEDRKAICGQTPTQAVSAVVDAAGEAPAPIRKVRAQKSVAQRVAARAPVTIGCPVSVPVARRYATTDGGSVVLCTASNGSLTGARSPIYPAGSGVGAALSLLRGAGLVIPVGQAQNPAAAPANVLKPPKGYELAWKDGRLNPLRGKGTAAGQAAQDKIWTRDVPAVAVVAKAKPKAGMQTTIAASNGSSAAALFIQVGAFGNPANAQGAAARLTALGLPVSKSKSNQSGKALQVVFAGPFASGADAQAALHAVRGNGFADAFMR